MRSISRASTSAPATPPSPHPISVTCNGKSNTPIQQKATPGADVTAARGRAGAPGGAAALGSNAKYSAPSESVDLDTGEITGREAVYNPMLSRVQRFMLQSVARCFLPGSRTDKCMRLRQGSNEIQVLQSKEHKTTSYSGLQTCGSVWACPVCSAKIAERRRVEIIGAMACHKAAGGCMHLLTLTAPHQRSDALGTLLASQAVALKKMFADKTVRKIFAALGVVGQIRALEVTHGRLSTHNNGWHPHYHLLLFSGAGVVLGNTTADQVKQWTIRLYERWLACCLAAGLGAPSFEHGLKLDDGSKAANYVAKWGLEDEMTKGHTKRAIHGETPFDFLRAYLVDKTDKQAGALFKEFAETFKGKRQLHWSPGLKKRFAIGESTDEELAAKKEDQAIMLGKITIEQWRDVLSADGRGTVLMLAFNSGWPAVELYLGSIKGRGIKSHKLRKEIR